MTKDEHCAHVLTLPGNEKWDYQEAHGITLTDVWRYKRDQKDTKPTRAGKKKRRQQVLTSQGGCCALCGLDDAGRWCLDKAGKVVCNSCNMFLTQYRKLRADGVTCEDMEECIGEVER